MHTSLADSHSSNSSSPAPSSLVLPPSAPPRPIVAHCSVLLFDKVLPLYQRPLTLRLFNAFCAAPQQQLGRHEAAAVIYPGIRLGGTTDRFVASAMTNTVKLISRARKLAQQHLGGPEAGLEWFYYDNDARAWALVRATVRYRD